MADIPDAILDDESPTADVWADEGRVSIVLRNASIIEYEGQLTPGVALSACGAIKLAENLLEAAREALEQEDGG